MYPERTPIFTCIVRGSGFLEWRYNNWEDHVALTTNDQLGMPMTYDRFDATLVNVTQTGTGETVLLSTLCLKRVIDNKTTITCLSGDHRENTSITVYKNTEAAIYSFFIFTLMLVLKLLNFQIDHQCN